MHILYTMARLYPFWAIPLGVTLIELGRFFLRRKQGFHVQCWVASGIFLLSSLGWILFRGDMNSDAWMRALFGS